MWCKCLIAVLFFFPQLSKAQNKKEQFIKAGVIAGINFSQVDGDCFAGYDKFGLNIGATAFIKFHKNWSIGFELDYSQKGSRQDIPPDHSYLPYKIKIDYLDVPLMLSVHDKRNNMFSAGLSYGTLMRHKEFQDGAEIQDDPFLKFKNTDLNFVAGVTFFVWEEKFGFNLRGAYSLIPIRFANCTGVTTRGVYNNYLSVRFLYLFNN